MAIIGVLAAIAIPKGQAAITHARVARAIGDISAIQLALMSLEAAEEPLPASLDEIGYGDLLDPWGQLYVFRPFPPGSKVPGGARKDRFLVPVNSTFDLYSLGPDGMSAPPFTAKASHDDIVRANDGGFVGLARNY